eukprot:6020385-Pleurochrysis_carterae.AAC.1
MARISPLAEHTQRSGFSEENAARAKAGCLGDGRGWAGGEGAAGKRERADLKAAAGLEVCRRALFGKILERWEVTWNKFGDVVMLSSNTLGDSSRGATENLA